MGSPAFALAGAASMGVYDRPLVWWVSVTISTISQKQSLESELGHLRAAGRLSSSNVQGAVGTGKRKTCRRTMEFSRWAGSTDRRPQKAVMPARLAAMT